MFETYQRVSSALVDEAEKEEAGCSGPPAQAAEKEAECRHAPEKEAECPDHSPEEEAEGGRSALTSRRRSALTRRSPHALGNLFS